MADMVFKAVGGSPGHADGAAPVAVSPVSPVAAPRPGFANEPKPVFHTPSNITQTITDRPNPGIGWIH